MTNKQALQYVLNKYATEDTPDPIIEKRLALLKEYRANQTNPPVPVTASSQLGSVAKGGAKAALAGILKAVKGTGRGIASAYTATTKPVRATYDWMGTPGKSTMAPLNQPISSGLVKAKRIERTADREIASLTDALKKSQEARW